jgi:hypothetical protein
MPSEVSRSWGLAVRARAAVSALLLHHPDVRITSGRRSPESNRRVGGAKRSRHLLGVAVDLVGPPATLRHLRARARAYGATEILDEGDHTHIAWPRDWAD